MKQELMICPNRKQCIYSCAHKTPHKKDFGCVSPDCSCPKCDTYYPKPKSMFAGLRKGDRVEITDNNGTCMVYYVSVDKLRMWYKVIKDQDSLFCVFKSKIKSIKKLAVKK